MPSNQLIPTDRSYWIAIIASLFVIGLLVVTIVLTSSIEEKSLKFTSDYLLDPESANNDRSLDIAQLMQLEEENWQTLAKENLGLSEFVHWFRIRPDALIPGSQYLLEINYGMLDHLDVWMFAQSDDVPSALTATAKFSVGDAQVFHSRPIQHEQFLFPILATTPDMTIILRVKSSGPIKTPIRLWQAHDFIEYSGMHKLFMGLFFGYMIAMALLNLFLYATTRNKTFAVYTGYVLSLAMVSATLHGIGFRYFWPESIWFQERAIAFFACSTLVLIILFSIQVLDLRKTSTRAYMLLQGVKWIFVLLAALIFVLPFTLLLQSILIMIALTAPMILFSSLTLAFQGNLVARYFSGAWAVLLAAGIGLTFENMGWYELPMDSSYLLMVGAIAETLLLALALAISFSTQYKEAAEARMLASENEKKALVAKDELLRMQEESKQALEYSVEERTLELEIAMRELSEANQELERLSAIDALTGLMNRRYFDKRLLAEARRSRREQRPLSLAILDIDFFKKINDSLGHLAGDECLMVFAQTLQKHIRRPSDIICRYGGEEFVVILPGTDLDGASKLMEKVRQAVEQAITQFEGKTIHMTVSIGVTSRIMASDDEQALIFAFADKLLYQAKNAGRNQVIAQVY